MDERKVYEEGVGRLAVAIVKQAFDDCEAILKAEYGRKIGHEIPGAIRSCPQVNMKEIREFMRDGLFVYIYDMDGEGMLDSFIRYARSEKIPREWGKYE